MTSRAVITEMLNILMALLNRTFDDASAEAAPNVQRDRSLVRRQLVVQLGVNYRWSKLVVDEQYKEAVAKQSAYIHSKSRCVLW